MQENSHCPLCAAQAQVHFHADNRRDYWRCTRCLLVYVLPDAHLSADEEKAIYDLHENSVDDPGYRRFLSRLADPLLHLVPEGSSGLDFGCGPGPALAQMLREAGHSMALYDVFYQPDTDVLQQSYDFICATEVVEHLHRVGDELKRLWRCLHPGGYLAVMTKLVLDAEAFSRWHYKNDLTHVCFFSQQTWLWWAAQHDAEVSFIGADVILLRSPVRG